MSRTSATRAVCSPRPRFSRLTPAVFTSESICGARVVSFFSRSTRRFFARLMGGAGATAGDGGPGGGRPVGGGRHLDPEAAECTEGARPVERGPDDHLVDVGRQAARVDPQLVDRRPGPLSLAEMPDGAVGPEGLVVEDEVVVATH